MRDRFAHDVAIGAFFQTIRAFNATNQSHGIVVAFQCQETTIIASQSQGTASVASITQWSTTTRSKVNGG